MNRDYTKLLKAGNAAQLEKLKENEHKTGFEDINIYYAYNRLKNELQELSIEMYYMPRKVWALRENINYPAIRHEAADIANFAHMIILQCDKIQKRKI